MAEKKSWRDYSKHYSGKSTETTDDTVKSEKTGSWKDYSKHYSNDVGGSSTGSWRDYSTTNTAGIVGDKIVNKVNNWLKNHNTYISNYQNRYADRKFSYEDSYVNDSADWMDTVSKQKSRFDEEYFGIVSYLNENKDYLNEDWVKKIKDTLNSARSTQSQIIDAATRDNAWWSGFGSEEMVKAYDSAENAYAYYQRDDRYSKQYAGSTYEDIKKALDSVSVYQEREWLLLNQGDIVGNTIRSNADFQEYASKGAGISYKDFGTETVHGGKSRRMRRTTSIDKYRAAAMAMYEHYGNEKDQGYKPQYDEQIEVFRGMTDDEFANLAYCIAKDKENGTNLAEQYVDSIEEKLNIKRGTDIGNSVKDIPVVADLYGVVAGLDQFSTGLVNLIEDKDYYVTSPTQAASGVIRESMEDDGFKLPDWMGGASIRQGLYDFTTTTSNMAPSILASYASNALIPGSGIVVGNALMGASAKGNAYAEAINRGYGKDEASLYSTAIGASEVVLGAALGGISKLGGISPALSKAVAGIDSGLARFALQYGGKIVSEGIEEGLQEILDPVFQNAILHADEDINWSEVVYSALLGGLSAGFLEGRSTYTDVKKETALNKKAFKQYGDKTADLIQEGLESDVKSDSYKLATKYQKQVQGKDGKQGKALTGAQIRQLLAANQEQITPKDLKKIQQAAEKRLTALGQTEDVQKLAELATKYATGQKMTREEKSFLANNKNGNRTANEMHPDNIFSGDYTSEWAEGIGTKKVNSLAYNIRNIIDGMANKGEYKSLESRMDGETPAKVSNTGKAVIRGTDEEVDLSNPKIKSITPDSVILDVNGKDIDTDEIDFPNEDLWNAFNAIKKIEHITPVAAESMIAKLDMNKPVWGQLNGMDEAFTYGYYNYSEADLNAGLFTGNLSKDQLTDSYKLGQYVAEKNNVDKSKNFKAMRTAAQAEAEKALAEGKEAPNAKNLTISYNEGGGRVMSIDEAGALDEKRSGAVEVAKFLHKLGLGTRFEFFKSKLSDTITVKNKKTGKVEPARVFIDDNGVEQVAYSGVYRKSDGTIRIDLNAYNGRGLALNALAHELTHFIQQWSDEKYKVLADFLIKAYEKTDMSMHKRVLREQARLKDIRGEDVSYDEAFDEVVANAMMKMFDDGKLVERLTELKAQDASLAKKLWEGFKKILAKFFDAYKDAETLMDDTADLMAMRETFEQLQNMFAEALVEASDNYQAYLTATENQLITEAGIGFDEDTRSVYSLHFSTAYQDTVQVGKKTFDTEAIVQVVAKGTGRSIEDARKWVKSEMTIANMVMANPEFLDFEADNRYEAIKKNSDYPQGTVDLSNLCPKREEFTAMFDRLQKKYPNKLFTAQDVAEMRKILAENDITVACGACFVEDRRQLLGEIADTYINMWKEAVESGKPLQKTNAAGVKSDLLVTKALAKQYGLTAGSKIMATDTYIPNQYDLTTYEGFKLLEKNHPTIAMGFNRYNNSRGQQSARLIEGRAEYNRQILGWSDAKVRSVNNNGGLRIFSFSDFEVVHLLDLVQVIIDCSARGVKIQGYTKIPAFAKLVRGTGIKLNRSLIPKGDYGYHMENGKVVLDYDTTEGIDINDDNFIDDRSDPDIGNIVIGINPTQIGAAMLEPFIDYIIPFHSNKAKEILKKLGTGEWVNYKESQHEKDISTGKASKHNVNIYTEVINKYHPTNKVDFVNAFLKECKRQGKIPRYAEFLNVDANGDYAYREGYHKLLVDFKMFDAEGNILPQGNITPSLDDGFMADLLNAEIKRKQDYKFPKKVYDAIDKQFGEQYSSQETDLDSEGNQLSTEQQEFFKDSVVRDANGKLMVVYHGTPNGRTTIFDKAKTSEINDMGQGIYFSTNKGDASSYMGKTRSKKLYSTHVNIKAPFVVSDNVKITVSEAASLLKLCDDRSLALDVYRGDVLINAKDGYITTSQLANTNISQQMTKILEKSGKYDGIIDETVSVKFGLEEGTKHIIALNSNQIKSIDNQKPTTNPDIRYSSQETDLDTETDSAYDSAKKETKQEVKANAGREETREDFHRRAVQEGCTVNDRGEIAYAFRPVADWNLSESVRSAERNLQKKGIQVIVCDLFEVNRDGITTQRTDAIAAAGEAVYLHTSMETDPIETAEHEAYHFWKHTQARMVYFAELYKNFDFDSPAAIDLLGRIEKAYIESKKANVETDLEVDSDESVKLIEEAFAYVTGYAASGDQLGIAHKILRDYDAVKAAWDDLIKKQTTQKGQQYSSQETDADNAPTFYSQMGKVVEGMKQEKFGASSVISMLRGRGVKAEEIRWSGIQAFLDGKKSVTKQELLDFINSSMLHIEEQERGGTKKYSPEQQKRLNELEYEIEAAWDEMWELWEKEFGEDIPIEFLTSAFVERRANKIITNANTEAGTEISKDSKRIIQLARLIDINKEEVENISYQAETPETKWDQYKIDGGANYREMVFKMPGATYTNMAMQGHWGVDAQGVLAHARIQDFDTADGKMLFIEEIQSDWHNQGHKEGYRKEGEKTERMLRAESKKAYEEFYTAVEKMLEDNADWEDDNAIYYAHPVVVAEMFDGNESHFEALKFTDEQKETIRAMVAEESSRQEALKTAPKQDMAPDAPFKENYHEFVLKRLLRMAAEEGYDSIGWTTADLQMDRWNPGRGTNETMGIKDAKNPDAIAFEEAYKNLYDRNMRKFLEKYGKQWGATVGKTDIQTKKLNQKQEADLLFMADLLEEGENYIRQEKGIKEVWSMDITPAMKKSVLTEGQAMYSSQETDLDSNGKKLGEDQLEYFEKSMARDRKGRLQVVYHGGTVEYEFDTTRGGNGSTQYGPGAYFTDSEYYAKEYTWYRGGNVRAYYLNIEKMFDDTNMDATVQMPQWKKLEQILRDNGIEDKFINGFANAGFAYMSRYLGNKAGITRSDSWGGSEILNGMLREAGFDGIKGTLNDVYQYTIFNPNQAKLTTNEVPSTFYDTRYSEHDTDYSNRDLLANAFEGITQNSDEYKMIQEYKNRIKLLNEQEEKLDKLNAEIRKIRFTNGEYDAQKLRELEAKAKNTAKEINKHDRKLLSLEASGPLRKVIEQERKKERENTRDHVKEIQQNKKLRAEQTEIRHKIRKAVRDLDKILNRGNKKQNVKEDMKGFVSKALELADYLFTDHISNDELIRRGITVRMTAKEAALVKETEDILSKLYDNADSLTDEEFTRLDAKRKANEDKLRDLLTAQRNERLNTPVYNLFNDLVTEYASLKNSSQDAVRAAYNVDLERLLRQFMGDTTDGADTDRKTLLQNMRVADMTTAELNKLYEAYKMVLTNVRDANKVFVKSKLESIDKAVEKITWDFSKRKTPDKKLAIVARNIANKIGWDYEKLYYALDRIGSETFTELVMNIANSENIVMQDVIEAAAFRDEMVEKYSFNNWDVNKEIDREFLDNTGKKFKLTLGQLMALYAYSRRDGAWDHIEYGGFVFGEAALTNPRPADSYKLNKAQCEAITNLLTKEQKGYAEDMQKYLSEVMGAKGNEVSMLLYGIKMFGEKNYFPIHIAGQFKAQANESQAKAAAGFSSMSNAGFTHAQNPNAKAPFVLEGFNEIWADHVNEMSRYHGTVPALEDMRRVMNRSSYSESGMDSMAIKQLMENSFGKEAVEYFDNLYREANSGAITDKLQKTSKKLLSMFRKNSVAYSLSVLIQQPTSIIRAYAMIDKKYFGIKGFGAITSGVAKAVSDKWTKTHTNAYNEMLKYAPGVTMTKEIGGFDTHTGGSIRSYLLDTNKSLKQKWKTGTALEKGKAVMDLVDDNAVANLPNLADKIAWIEIWNACKRETVATHKDLTPNSEEFMQAVGDRFAEVIRATQVYDSMFAKSPMLKSKNLAVQYLVSFMNEPNTVANMAESALRDATRGNWKSGAKKAAVLIYGTIMVGMAKSVIYAMRDDDEDETFIEKYIEALTGSLLSDFNPISYIPVARDVLSAAQGYDVERPDMAIVVDAISAVNAVIKNSKDTDGMSEEELAEFDKKVTEANWKLVESIAAFFGIPVKNIRRDIKGVIDHARIASANAGKTTAQSAWDKIYDGVVGSIPFMSTPSKQDKLYDAIISGDKAYLDRMKGTYKTDDAYHSAVRKALRENDPRIQEAAQARYEGRTEDYKRIFREIKNEGKFTFDDIMSAINTELSKLTPDKVTSDYTASGYVEAIAMGNTSEAQVMKDDIIATKVANGKTEVEAEKEFISSVVTGIRDAYYSGLLDNARTEEMLMEYAGKDEEETASKIRYWTFSEEHPEFDLSESNVNDYLDFAEPAEIPLDVFVQYINGTKGLADKKDEWGDVEVTKREQVLEVIHSLPLTRQQKDALYLAAGYPESKIWDVPW